MRGRERMREREGGGEGGGKTERVSVRTSVGATGRNVGCGPSALALLRDQGGKGRGSRRSGTGR